MNFPIEVADKANLFDPANLVIILMTKVNFDLLNKTNQVST